MKFLTTVLVLASTFCFAQNKEVVDMAAAVSTESLKKDLYYLAGKELAGRLTGSRGDTLASKYVAQRFEANGLISPYKDPIKYFQPVPLQKKTLQKGTLMAGSKTFNFGEGWSVSLSSGKSFEFKNSTVAFAGYGLEHQTYNDLANLDLQGKVVLIMSGQPRDSEGKYLLSGTAEPAQIRANLASMVQKGAAAVLIYDPRLDAAKGFSLDSVSIGRLPATSQSATAAIPVIMVSRLLADQVLSGAKKTLEGLAVEITSSKTPKSFDKAGKLSASVQIKGEQIHAPNVIGMIQGTDADAEAIVVSAHHDHMGKRGNDIYYGAVDNASGTVAIMELSTLMNKAIKAGIRPKRSVIFASFTAEEQGLLGSSHYVTDPAVSMEKTRAILNIDMMGRVDTFYSGRRADSSYAYILVSDKPNRGLRTSLYKANEALGELKLDTHYEQPQFMQRRLAGSDQYPFFLKGVPFIRIDCGFSKDYHKPTDTADKINYELLAKQVRLAFLTMCNLAND